MRPFVLRYMVQMLATLAALPVLTGCATTRPAAAPDAQYGNFAPDSPGDGARTMADDAVRRLLALYPPAHTRFELRQAAPDAFGQALIAALRTSGYALLESKAAAPEPTMTANRANNTSLNTSINTSINPSINTSITLALPRSLPSVTLHYILDLDPDSQLYRITLLIGKQSLTRAYLTENGAMLPASAWMRKE